LLDNFASAPLIVGRLKILLRLNNIVFKATPIKLSDACFGFDVRQVSA
jgi:hypothetical protein